MRYANNPASPPSPVTGTGGTSAPFNFMNYQPSASGAASPGAPGIGSNQYQSLPSWMNTSVSRGGGAGSFGPGGYTPWQPAWGPNPPAFQQIPGIGSWMQNQLGQQQAPTQQQLMNQASSSPAYAATRQQLLSQIPGGSLVSNPTTYQLMHDIMGTNIPMTNPQGGPWAMGTPQQELMAQGANLWQPLSSQQQFQPTLPPIMRGQPSQNQFPQFSSQLPMNPFTNNLMGGGQASQQLQNMFNQFTGASAQPQMNSIQQQMLQTLFSPQQGYGYGLLGGGQWL